MQHDCLCRGLSSELGLGEGRGEAATTITIHGTMPPLLSLLTDVFQPPPTTSTPLVWLLPLPQMPPFPSPEKKRKPFFQVKMKKHLLYWPFLA